GAAITILTLYTAQYVMNAPEMAPFFILSYMVFSFALTPLWMPLAKRFGKKRLWLGSMLTTAFAFGCMITLEPGMELRLLVLAGIAGAAGSCGGTINPSIKSDIIDLDEYRTGERKEGAYFAAWYFVSKSAYGVTLMITGFALSIAGFVPNAAQSATVIWTFKGLYAGAPFFAYIIGAILFSTFNFEENEHKKVIAELEAKRGKR
ncbi:MAG: MFS transporter, partial [Parvibaculales bacterium]